MSKSFIIGSFLSIIFLVLFFLNIDRIFEKKKQPLAKLILFEGKVSSRPMDLTIWKPAIKNQDFFSGDVIATEKSSKAEISFFEGKKILLEENSQVVIRAQKASSKEEMISIRLIKGQIETKFVKTQTSEKKETDKNVDTGKKFALISGQSTVELSNSELKIQKEEGKKIDIQVQSGEAKIFEESGKEKKINVLTNITNPVLNPLSLVSQINQPAKIENIPGVSGLNLNVELSQIPIKIEELEIESPSSGYFFTTVNYFNLPIRIAHTKSSSKEPYEIIAKINDEKEKSFFSKDRDARINIQLTSLTNKIKIYVKKKGFRSSRLIDLDITSLYEASKMGKWIGISSIENGSESAIFRQKSLKEAFLYIKFKNPQSLRWHSGILKNSDTIVLKDSIRSDVNDFHLIENKEIDATIVSKRDTALSYAKSLGADLMFFGKENDLIPKEKDTQTVIAKHFITNDKIYLAGDHSIFLLKRNLFEKFPHISVLIGNNIKAAFKEKVDLVWIKK